MRKQGLYAHKFDHIFGFQTYTIYAAFHRISHVRSLQISKIVNSKGRAII